MARWGGDTVPSRGYQRSRGRGTGPNRGSGRVRIVAGALGGRRIRVPDAAGLRPTPERTRETLFNWLQGRLAGARVLDLFAGSGILGFEALSRGAAVAVLVERDPAVAAMLRTTAGELGLENARIVRGDALVWLERADPDARFELVLIDPPFDADLATPALALLADGSMLAPQARVYCEWMARKAPPWAPERWEVLRETRAGDSRAVLLALRPAGAERTVSGGLGRA